MSEKSIRKPIEAEAAAKQEPKYEIGKLRAHCMELFSISTSTFDGAMYGNTDTTLTINEARARINKWLGRKE